MRSLLRNLLAAGISLAVALVLGELALRSFAPIPYAAGVEYRADPHVAFVLHPSRVYGLPGGGTCTINSRGFRGADFEVPKPEGVFRIVAFGGSSTFCYLTDDPKVWTARLEDELTRTLDAKVEVLNVALPGRSSFESKILYLYKVRQLEPDAVILYHTWNDMKQFRGIEADGELRKATYRPFKWKDFLKKFELPRRVRLLQKAFGSDTPLAPREEKWIEADPDLVVEIPEDGIAHRFARKNYDDIALLMSADGVLPIFASQAGLLHHENMGDREIRERVYTEFQGLGYEEIVRQWDWITATLEETALRHDGLFVDVRAEVPHDLEHFRDHVHLTDQGNQAVADSLARALVESPRFLRAVSQSRPD